MNCPRCSGHNITPLGGDTFRCTSQIIVDVVPAGVAGNPVQVPIYRTCDAVFDRLQGERATAALAQADQLRQQTLLQQQQDAREALEAMPGKLDELRALV